jgi:transcriptional regulator with XRE-family HTH domain
MESSDTDILTIDVGGRLRQLRLERGKSLRALARASGLSTNALSMIERSKTSPSISTLYKIADALEVPITAFFRLEPTRQTIVFRKSSERKRVKIPQGIWEGLGGESFSGRLEPFLITIESGGGSGPYGMLHSGNEFVLCLEGLLEYELEGEQYLLEAGDSLIFAAQMRHRWMNPGKTTVTAVIVLGGFEEGERPSEFHLAPGMRNLSASEEGDIVYDSDEEVED